MGIYGQDWASYQPSQPDTSGLSFAFVKITEGREYTNSAWTAQRDHAKAQGLVFGGYHYPHMGNDPHAEADRFLSLMQPQPGDLIVLDWEGYDPANSGVSASRQLAYKESWLRYVKAQAPHNPVGMYCNTDYWRRVDTTGYYADFLWIATAGASAGNPGINAPWMFHQYSDTPVDSDYCHLSSVNELRQWALSFAGTQPPQEADMTPDELLNARMPEYARMPDGYLPTVGECINGAKQADDRITQLGQQVTAQAAAITALATQIGATHPGVDTAAVIAAVQAAIAAAVVHVDVTVASPTPTTTP